MRLSAIRNGHLDTDVTSVSVPASNGQAGQNEMTGSFDVTSSVLPASKHQVRGKRTTVMSNTPVHDRHRHGLCTMEVQWLLRRKSRRAFRLKLHTR